MVKLLCQNLNIHHLVSHSKDKEKRIDAFMEIVKAGGYDLVMLQEIFVLTTVGKKWGVELRQRIVEKAKEAGLNYTVASKPANVFFGQDAGLMILSRWPIKHDFTLTFREYGWKESPNKKGILHAVIDMPNGTELNVITGHLDAHEPTSRAEQIKQIRKHLDGHTFTNGYVVIGGDFNVPADTPEFKTLRNCLHPLRDGWLTEHTRTYPSTSDHGICVDYVFYSANIRVAQQRTDNNDVSDHYAIISDFEQITEDPTVVLSSGHTAA